VDISSFTADFICRRE